jgi:hypothetical protein
MKPSLRLIQIGITLIIFLIMLGNSACQKKEDYPDTPQIEFLDFTKIQNGSSVDNKGILSISFTDGDGNIGLAEGDTLAPFNVGSPYYYNFYINYYERRKGSLVLVDLPSPQHARIPPIVGTGDNKPTKGTIDIELFINNYSSPYDTILFEAWIYDKELQQSNVIRTPEIIVNK